MARFIKINEKKLKAIKDFINDHVNNGDKTAVGLAKEFGIARNSLYKIIGNKTTGERGIKRVKLETWANIERVINVKRKSGKGKYLPSNEVEFSKHNEIRFLRLQFYQQQSLLNDFNVMKKELKKYKSILKKINKLTDDQT